MIISSDGIIGLFLYIAGLEFIPAIAYYRVYIPDEIALDMTCDCQCLLDTRPWFATLNYWLWLWILATPVMMFSVTPSNPKWQRIMRTLVTFLFGYVMAHLSLHLMHEIQSAPFIANFDPAIPEERASWDRRCANISDGASIVFMFVLGWFYSLSYTGMWLTAWHYFYKTKSKKMETNYKLDRFHKIFMVTSIIITVLIVSYFSLALYEMSQIDHSL